MIVLLDWAHRPVLVQLVEPDQTTIGLPLLSSRTANLLCPIWAELLNIRFCSRLPISFESLARTGALVVSQMVTFLGLAAPPLVVFFTAFLTAFFAGPAFFAALTFFA